MAANETNQGFFQTILGKLQALFSTDETADVGIDEATLFAFTEDHVIDFVKDFVKEEDDLMGINFAMGEGFKEPEEYDSYGCNRAFFTAEEAKESRGIETKADFQDAYLVMHNYYLKPKITGEDGIITGFPPTFNYPSDDAFTLEAFSEEEAKVRVDGKTPCLFTIKKDTTEEEGKIITSIVQSIRYVGDVERLDY